MHQIFRTLVLSFVGITCVVLGARYFIQEISYGRPLGEMVETTGTGTPIVAHGTMTPPEQEASPTPIPAPAPIEVKRTVPPKKTEPPKTTPVVTQEKPTKTSIVTPGALYVAKPTVVAPTTDPLPVNEISVPSSSGALNQNDIMMIVNTERQTVGLSPLSFSAQLTRMAEAKASDMIEKQYFAHVAPDGTDVVQLAERYGYVYLNVGENLAMGDFVSSVDVMKGWMDSPGHRANILNKDFTEIGVSAIRGNYEGRIVWYAVQEFGRPASACPAPDRVLEKKIALYHDQIVVIEETLSTLRTELLDPNVSPAIYNTKVKDYNTIIGLYNGLIETLKVDVATYNAGVSSFNACISR